jgi:hypothetical protein
LKQSLPSGYCISLIVTLLFIASIFSFRSNTVYASYYARESFTVGDGTISGPIVPIEDPHKYQQAQTARAILFKMPLDELFDKFSARYFVLSGKLVNGTYKYSFALTVQKGGSQLAALELVDNPEAHTQLIIAGTPTREFLERQGAQGDTHQQSLPIPSKNMQVAATRVGSQATSWLDPVGLKVNEVFTSLDFSYNHRTVGIRHAHDSRWWLSETGWAEITHRLSSDYGVDNSSAFAKTNDHMQNQPFCVGNLTDVYYEDNVIIGHANGDVSGGVDTWATGTCQGLLHYATVVSG